MKSNCPRANKSRAKVSVSEMLVLPRLWLWLRARCIKKRHDAVGRGFEGEWRRVEGRGIQLPLVLRIAFLPNLR